MMTMIKKVSNWVFGSFFRTMGRFFFFLFFGFLLATILSKSNIKITDLLGIETVKADSYVGGMDEVWYDDENLTQQWTSGITYQYKTLQSTTSAWNNMQYFKAYASNQYSMTPFKGGHITIPFVFDFPLVSGTDGQNSNITYYTCKTWTQQSSGSYICTSYDDQSFVIRTTDYEYIPPVIQMNAYIEYTNGYNDNCEINFNTNYISCPVANREDLEIKNFLLVYKFLTTWSGNFKFGLGLKFNGWSNDTNTVINNQNQNTNQTISTITDTNTTEADTQANNFFSNFSSQDNGGISSIITAPLSAISGLVSSTCTPITLPLPYLDNKTIVLPCMSAIYTEHFGAFFTIYQTIIFGAIAYRMLVSIFMMIQGFKNPDDDKIEVVDL